MRQRFGNLATARAWMAPAALAALWTVAFLAFKPTPWEGIDYVRFYEPYQRFLRESVLRGELPWWNPYSSLGRPFLIDLQTAALYPATLLILAFGAKWGWVMGTFLHGMVGAEGFSRLARRFGASAASATGGAAVFLFCGPLVARMQEGEVNVVYALCFVPWVLWIAADIAGEPTRRRWAGLTMAMALQIWCGHPQIFWLSAIGAGLFTTGLLAQPPWGLALRKWIRAEIALLASCVAAMALLGCVLVPFMELAGQSNRAVPSAAFSGAFSMGSLQWMALVWPTWSAFGVNWEYNLFAGVTVAVGALAAIARWRGPATRGIIVMAAGAAVIASGPATPLFGVLYAVLPGMHSFRVPARAGVLVTFALILGASAFAGRSRSEAAGRTTIGWLSAAALVWAVVFALGPFPAAAPGNWIVAEAGVACLAGMGWWLWIGAQGQAPVRISRARYLILPLAVAAELFLSTRGIKQSYRFQSQFPGEAAVLGALHATRADLGAAPPRVCVDSTVFRENAGMIYRVASVVGYESLSLGRVWNYLHLASGADPSHAFSTVPDGRIFAAASRLRAFNLSASLGLGSTELEMGRGDADPRAYLVPKMAVVADENAAIAAMISGGDFHRVALVESAFAGVFDPQAGEDAGTAAITRFGLNSIDVAVASPGRSVLVLAEAWYPGWTAEIDGRALPCVPVNDWMRGVPVPAGNSVVHLRFHQDGLATGVALSIGAAAALLFAWRPRRNPV